MAQRTKQNFPLTVPLFQSNPQISSTRHQKEWRCPICGAIFDQEQTKDIHMASCKRNSHPQQFHNYHVVDNPISELFMYFYLNNSIYLEHFYQRRHNLSLCVYTHNSTLKNSLTSVTWARLALWFGIALNLSTLLVLVSNRDRTRVVSISRVLINLFS